MVDQTQNFGSINSYQFYQNFNHQQEQNMNQNQIMSNINQFNMMQNLNFFNNMNLMLQYQMMQGMMNQINYFNNNSNNKNNFNQLNISPNQVHLIDSIISFFKENNYEYMNYDNPNQIKFILNLIDPKFPGLKYNNINEVQDPLYYIKGHKITIKFINSDFIIYKVRIPKSISKFDLYTIAKLYKFHKNSNSDILLIYNNNILNNDESSIEFISENDEFRIVELRNYPDDSYYKFLNQKNIKKQNIIITFLSGHKVNFILPEDITISEMIYY